MKVCNNCGNPVKETDKFCSNCGAKLSDLETFESQKQFLKFKICDLCGEENPIDLDECSYCGVGFSGKEKIIEKKVTIIKQEHPEEIQTTHTINKSNKAHKTYHPKKKKQQNQNQRETKTSVKKLETKHFLLFGIIIIGLISILVYTSSDFSSLKNTSNQKPQKEIQSGIDLNALNEINRLENELKSDPENQQKLLQLANLSHDAGFYEKAITYYDRYLKLNPNDNDAEVDKGVCYFELKQYDKATSIFESVINKNPRHQIAYLNLGIVTLTKGDVEKAKEFFKKCIELGEHTDAGHRAAELLKSH